MSDLETRVEQFVGEQQLFLGTQTGHELLQNTLQHVNSLSQSRAHLLAPAAHAQAESALAWINRLPTDVVMNREAVAINLSTLSVTAAMQAVTTGLQVVRSGVMGLIMGGGPMPGKDVPDTILHAAFGADAAAQAIRTALTDPKLPLPKALDDFRLPELDKLVREGTLRELIRTFAECGYAARAERDWVNAVEAFGRVVSLTPGRACAGTRLTVAYAGFGHTAPDPAKVADLLIAIPTRTGCTHVSVRTLMPDVFSQWQDTGTITVVLPDDVFSGCVGFFTTPPPLQGGGPCEVGSLATAAGLLQSVVAEQFGPMSVAWTQTIVDIANKAELGRHRALPCPSCNGGRAQQLLAGPPVIGTFTLDEPVRSNNTVAPIFPEGYVTLRWHVNNADTVEIHAEQVAGSEGAHELPPIAGPLPAAGTLRIPVNVTKRWEAEYVLHATNANNCGAGPVEARVRLRSGYSVFQVGAHKVDITDRSPGLRLAGFAYDRQETTGIPDKYELSIPLFARAFVVRENLQGNSGQYVALVVADIWTCSQKLKTEVVRLLQQQYGPGRFTNDNVLIAGTHTHSAPGGYSDYHLYNLSIEGFEQRVFDRYAHGIADAIKYATMALAPGRLYVNAGDLAECGANRSFAAYERNAEVAAGAGPDQWTDREMMLLKLVRDVDNCGATQPLGALNWYALHPTNLGMYNLAVSGDNKGWAELRFEEAMAAQSQGFVAAFGNACAGDVSGNVTLDVSGRATRTIPLGGAMPRPFTIVPILGPDPATASAADRQRLITLGERQKDHALHLFNTAQTEVTGRISTSYAHVDMSQVDIAGTSNRTWPAALGFSFGAGSTEDGYAVVKMADGLDINPYIVEGMDQAAMAAGLVGSALVLSTMGTDAVAIAIAIATGQPIAPALATPVMKAVATIVFDHPRSVIAALIAAGMFGGKLLAPTDPNGTWRWDVPALIDLPPAYVNGHGQKPIMFPVGLATLTFTPTSGSASTTHDVPLVPHVLPFQMIRIGSVAIAGVPSELTATAGRRLKATIRAAFNGTLTHLAISNYTNAYSGYVTTPEEYSAQHYEGASTLYGPHTLAAYLQTFEVLVAACDGRAPVPTTMPFMAGPAVLAKVRQR